VSQSNSKVPRFNLHDILNAGSYNHAVLCTFTFDFEFFEEYCLEKLTTLRNNANITVLTDWAVYQQIVAGSSRPGLANLRYLLHPVLVPGCFHPKIVLLTSKTKGKLIIGSANITRPGITSNAELVGCYEYESLKNEQFGPLFKSVFVFLKNIESRWPSSALTSNLSALEREAEWLNYSVGDTNPAIHFLHNLDQPLLGQLSDLLNHQSKAVHILSRYFDSKPRILDSVKKKLGGPLVSIFTQNGITTLTKEWFRHPDVSAGRARIYFCTYSDDGGHRQPLHAKAIAFEKDKTVALMFGSANFTAAAMSKTSARGNVEAGVFVEMPQKALKPYRLFDPLGNGLLVRNEALLRSDLRENSFPKGSYDITLSEATLGENSIGMKARVHVPFRDDLMFAAITFQDNARKTLKLIAYDDEEWRSEECGELLHRFSQASCMVAMEGISVDGVRITSNPLLLTNLLDIHTGDCVRKERRIKEAQQDANQFFRVLRELIEDGDDAALITFFNFCEIPILETTRMPISRGRPGWDGGKGMRKLGARNLKIFVALHDAAIHFFDRHYKKLDRHVKKGSLNGLGNYLHIFLSMGAILRAQVERGMQGIEGREEPLSIEQWHQYRDRIDMYFRRFSKMMVCLQEQYLPRMLKEYNRSEVIKRFGPDLDPIKELFKDMLSFKKRMDELKVSRLTVRTPYGNVVPARFYPGNVFCDGDWSSFASEQNRRIDRLIDQIAV
jgi:hypothetical protein